MDTEPQPFWCSYCGRDIWKIPGPQLQPEHLICTECKNILDSYEGYDNAQTHETEIISPASTSEESP